MTATPAQLAALKSAVKLVAHVVSDSMKALKDATLAAKLADYSNIIPDLQTMLPEMGDISVSSLAPEDYAALVVEIGQDFQLTDAHAEAIVTASIALIVGLIAPVKALMSAIKAPAVTAA